MRSMLMVCNVCQASTWNYGQNFGGGTGSPTEHSGGE